jgi:imidazolonepropionase-like amidohydrolase
MFRNAAVLALISTLALSTWAFAQDDARKTLISNVPVFDGVSEQRIENANVLIEGNLIKAVSTDTISTDGATLIDGGGRTLMPGLSDTHVHLAFGSLAQTQVLVGDLGYNFIHQTKDAEGYLMRGVTVVRDMGGNVFGLKQAIDEDMVPGPRIYASGGPLSQTAETAKTSRSS